MEAANYIGPGQNAQGAAERPVTLSRLSIVAPMSDLARVFAADGLLAAHLPGFRHRKPQAEMAALIGQVLAEGGHALVEAGTGIGKTFAYLVPILQSGRRAIISTGTKTLQDQLFGRDLPLLGRALGRPVDIAVLKGRANYLCAHRLQNARLDGRLKGSLQSEIDALAAWGRSSSSGDLTEIGDLEEKFELRSRVTSTAENCLGSQCPEVENCFVLRARRRAQAASVVIVNHHLLLADLSLRESGFGELLPGADCVIVDEAHMFPEIAQQFFDVSVSSRQILRLGHDLADEARVAGIAPEIEKLALGLAKASAELVVQTAQSPGRRRGLPAGIAPTLADLEARLGELGELLVAFENDPALSRCRERAVDLAGRLAEVREADPDGGLQWLEAADQSCAVHFTPFDFGKALAARIADQGGSWIFTSASLAVGDDFSHFSSRLGIEPQVEAVLPSPFDYQAQAALYLPRGLPEPNEEGHTAALLAQIYPLILAADGGAFLLFTSHRALADAERWLEGRRLPGPRFVQGGGSRSRLLEEFRAAGNGVLLGTGSFWQGVDVRGPALRLVMIDKLPFAVPGDPLVQARIESIRQGGGEPFRAFQLPEAVLALKQGVGRLIRDFDDRGLVVIGDPRLRSRSYGRVFLESLPAFARIEDPAAALAFAESLSGVPASMTA